MNFKQYLSKAYDETKIKKSKSRGVDGINGEQFINLLENTDEVNIILNKLNNQTYKFSYYVELLKIKSHNNTRKISVPTQRDKLVLKSIYEIIKDKYKYTPKIREKMIREVKQNYRNYTHFIKVDIKKFFDKINHQILFDKLEKKFPPYIFKLIKQAVTQKTISLDSSTKERKSSPFNKKGVPQGLPISNILGDLYLQEFDEYFNSLNKIKYFRFVDDILILCNEKEIKKLKKEIKNKLGNLKLKPHKFSDNKDKSHHNSIQEGFQYLGYIFYPDKITIRKSSVQNFYKRLNKIFTKFKYQEKNFISELFFIQKINKKIEGYSFKDKQIGWLVAFKEINDYKLLNQIDNFIDKKIKEIELESFLKEHNLEIKKLENCLFDIRKN